MNIHKMRHDGAWSLLLVARCARMVGGSRPPRWPPGSRCGAYNGWRGIGGRRARPPRSQLGARPIAPSAARRPRGRDRAPAPATPERPQIARRLQRPRSTVGLVLRRLGLGRRAALEPRPPVIRYQRASPGELLHIDTKKLGRIDGIGHRISGDRTGRRRHSAGRSSTSPSTMPPGSPTARCSHDAVQRHRLPRPALGWFGPTRRVDAS